MRRQIVKMEVNGTTYLVVNDSKNKYNPLAVIKKTNYIDEHGVWQTKQKTIDKWADLNSAMCCIMSEIHHRDMVIVSADRFYGK